MVAVAITQNDDIGTAIDAALSHLDLHDLLHDRLVAIKPNDTYATPGDRSGVTQPDTLRAVMAPFIVAMVQRFPIQLGIIPGHPAMIATGPLGGKPVETGMVIASRDVVAADTVGARLLGFNAQGMRHLWEAGQINLGQTETGKMTFPALSLEDAVKVFTEHAYGQELTFQHA